MGWTNRQAVALFRTSCDVLDVPAFLSHPTAPHLAAFYLAIARSAVCASPVPHNSSLSCDLTRTRRSAQAAVSVQTHCSRHVDSLAGRTCVMFAKWTEARTQEPHRLCPLFADRTQEDGKQTGRGQAHIPASHALTVSFSGCNGSWHGRNHHNFNEHPRSPKVGREASPRRRVCRIDPLVPNRIVIFEQTHVSDPDLGA